MSARTLLGYATVSGVCVVLNNVILIAADRVGLGLLGAILLSFTIVVTVGYILHSMTTFRQPLGLTAFGRYIGSMALNVPLAIGTLWLCNQILGLAMLYAAPLATVYTMITNFLLSRWAIRVRLES